MKEIEVNHELVKMTRTIMRLDTEQFSQMLKVGESTLKMFESGALKSKKLETNYKEYIDKETIETAQKILKKYVVNVV